MANISRINAIFSVSRMWPIWYGIRWWFTYEMIDCAKWWWPKMCTIRWNATLTQFHTITNSSQCYVSRFWYRSVKYIRIVRRKESDCYLFDETPETRQTTHLKGFLSHNPTLQFCIQWIFLHQCVICVLMNLPFPFFNFWMNTFLLHDRTWCARCYNMWWCDDCIVLTSGYVRS